MIALIPPTFGNSLFSLTLWFLLEGLLDLPRFKALQTIYPPAFKSCPLEGDNRFVSQGSLTARNNAQGSPHLGRSAPASCGGEDGALVPVSSAAGEELHLGWCGREHYSAQL